MAARNSLLRYGTVAMTFHWIIALLIVVNVTLGFWFANVMERGDPNLFMTVQIHKSIGLTVLVLSILRVGWRLINPVPPMPSGMSPGLVAAARASHTLLYVFIIAVPLAGWVMVSASPLGNPIPYFGLFEWPHISFLADLPRATKVADKEMFEETHAILAYATLALVVVHVLAALYHQFSRHDDVMRRMLPGTEVGPAS
jgi:cytochrome b561